MSIFSSVVVVKNYSSRRSRKISTYTQTRRIIEEYVIFSLYTVLHVLYHHTHVFTLLPYCTRDCNANTAARNERRASTTIWPSHRAREEQRILQYTNDFRVRENRSTHETQARPYNHTNQAHHHSDNSSTKTASSFQSERILLLLRR
jgi:hypothetical protein